MFLKKNVKKVAPSHPSEQRLSTHITTQEGDENLTPDKLKLRHD
jgi:hypothetical protein